LLLPLNTASAELVYEFMQFLLALLLWALALREYHRTKEEYTYYFFLAFSVIIIKHLFPTIGFTLSNILGYPNLNEIVIPPIEAAWENFSYSFLGGIILKKLIRVYQELYYVLIVYLSSVISLALVGIVLRNSDEVIRFDYHWVYAAFQVFNIVILSSILIGCYLHKHEPVSRFSLAFSFFFFSHLFKFINFFIRSDVGDILKMFSEFLTLIAYLILLYAVYSRIMREIVNKTEKLKELDRMKSKFIAIVSHELKTPLSAMKISNDLLLKEDIGELNPKQEKLLTLIKKNNDRLIRMINELLDLSRIETGKFMLNLKWISLNGFVKKVFEDFKLTVKESGYIYEEYFHPEEVEFFADEDKLSQVLLNLFQNAYKYTVPGQKIGVKTRITPNQVIIEVFDSGKGLESGEADKVFESFYQVEERDVKEMGGLGLGLTISKYIVNEHGGSLEIVGKEGMGTRVICTIPRIHNS